MISPGDKQAEIEEKVFSWLDAGSSLVAVVNPRQRTLTAYRSSTDIRLLRENEILDADDVVPGWQLKIAELFA